jgi:hypothetical protein
MIQGEPFELILPLSNPEQELNVNGFFSEHDIGISVYPEFG